MRNRAASVADSPAMLWFAVTPLPFGALRLRAYRLAEGRLWLTHDIEGPVDQVLDELRELARPPPAPSWVTPAR